ncbi:MAG: sulfite exporter TauE/SafE family protein [Sulfurospirillaceae bacterium]|nr:sulfite exporter TauE/SafE family protein [Sulfurospirillaceae bacterium]
MELLPESMGLLNVLALMFSCFVGAAITTGVGMGGGILVIGIMSLFLPISALIPIHALTQAGSGIIRAFIFRKSVLLRFFGLFALGTLVGYAIATQFIVVLPESSLKLFLGVGIIILMFLPSFEVAVVSAKMIIALGVITGFLTMFVGVMGPIVGAFLASFLKERHIIVGTLAWCLSFQNLGKALIFGKLGFDFSAWLFLIALLIFASYLGVLVGKKALDYSNNDLFKKILKIACIFLGGKLVVDAVRAML